MPATRGGRLLLHVVKLRGMPEVIPNHFRTVTTKGERRGFQLRPRPSLIGKRPARPAFTILGAITFCHLLNDVMQALLPAIYPMLKSGLRRPSGRSVF